MSNETNFMVIDFAPTGVATAMHRDCFDLGFLGRQKIERASEIKFDEDTQKWDVWPRFCGGYERMPCGCGFDTYDLARKFEVKWLELARLTGVLSRESNGELYEFAMIGWRLRPEFGLDNPYKE